MELKCMGSNARVCKCGALVKTERWWVALGTRLRATSGKVDVVVGGCVNGDVNVCRWRRR